ncbi:MAG: helix-turn-helix domain-containing protein [Rhodospirillales bacterium]|nr:helix-turn-helix domain-containing protein [Acetobacter sp.]
MSSIHTSERSNPVGPDAAYSVKEVAALGGISRATLYRMWRRGEGPARTRISSRTVVFGRDWLAFVAQLKTTRFV